MGGGAAGRDVDARRESCTDHTSITLRKPRGRGGLLYVPAELAALVRERIAVTARMQDSLEEISEINLELLSRRQLD